MISFEEALERLLGRIEALGAVTDTPGALTRSFHSPANLAASRLVGRWMEEAGMRVSYDAGGTVRGILAARGEEFASVQCSVFREDEEGGVPSDQSAVIRGEAGEKEVPSDQLAVIRGKAGEWGAGRSPFLEGRPLLMGSHLDTVIDAGKYDGALGVLMAIAALEVTGPLGFPVHVLGFSDEEGMRFHATYLGSRACVGELTREILEMRDVHGISVGEVLECGVRAAEEFASVQCSVFREEGGGGVRSDQCRVISGEAGEEGGTSNSELGTPNSEWGGGEAGEEEVPSDQLAVISEKTGEQGEAGMMRVEEFHYAPGECRGYVEVHIEQGRVLEELGEAVCGVTGICGQSRLMLSLRGQADHAGTTPMEIRRDALAGACECVLAVEALGRRQPPLVATVGKMEIRPGASNAIPGEVRFTLDFRHPVDAVREALLGELLGVLAGIAESRGLELGWEMVQENGAVPCDADLREALLDAVEAVTGSRRELPSGAGHDAVMMATAMPVGMVFVRCRGGLSHHPEEYASPEDVGAGLRVLVGFLRSAK